jgi:hypothetical protein
VADVRDQALGRIRWEVVRLLASWKEHRNLVFFNDPGLGLSEAFLALRAGDLDGALVKSLETLERCAEARPHLAARVRYNAGICLFIRGDYPAAMPLLREARDLDPGNGVLREAWAECQRELRMERAR